MYQKPRTKNLLRQMLYAHEFCLKKSWGYKNFIFAYIGDNKDKKLFRMEKAGLVKLEWKGDIFNMFSATRKGAILIGFKDYQLRKAGLTEAG